jgi:hypothetical protein
MKKKPEVVAPSTSEAVYFSGNAILIWGAYVLFIQKNTFQNMKKYELKFCAYI